jgi:Protein of unknown function (DUF1569)
MKTILGETTRDALIARINALSENSLAQWGKMNAYEMMKHCRKSDEMFNGTTTYKRVFIGRIIGRFVLKSVLKDEKPLQRNSPTVPQLRIKESGDFDAERAKWLALVEAYSHFSNSEFVHPFFGKMTKEQIGFLVYKHIDHHLRQFNC